MPKEKQNYEMTRQEYADHETNPDIDNITNGHRSVVRYRAWPLLVEQAIEQGLDVPPDVLKEYSELE